MRGQQPGRDLGGVPAQRQRLLHHLWGGRHLWGPLRRQVVFIYSWPPLINMTLDPPGLWQAATRYKRMQELAIWDSLGGLKLLAAMEVWPGQDSSRILLSILLLFRAPWCSVCCGCSGRDTDLAGHEISPHRHWELCSEGAQEDCRMVREHLKMKQVWPQILSSAVFTWTNLLVVVAELDGGENEALDLVPLVTNVVLEVLAVSTFTSHSFCFSQSSQVRILRYWICYLLQL